MRIIDQIKYIVSGDKHLLKLSGYMGLQMIKPQEFYSMFLPVFDSHR